MSLALLALAAIAPVGPDVDRNEQIVFPSAEVAFETGIEICEDVYVGSLGGERSQPSKLGPFSRRGFYMSRSGDEAKVNMLMLSQLSHVYKASVSDGKGVVYALLTQSLLTCRVGSFDATQSHVSALATFADRKSGWVAKHTKSSSPSAKMQLFEKDLGLWTLILNISWPSGADTGPNGLTAMATMAANKKPPASVQ